MQSQNHRRKKGVCKACSCSRAKKIVTFQWRIIKGIKKSQPPASESSQSKSQSKSLEVSLFLRNWSAVVTSLRSRPGPGAFPRATCHMGAARPQPLVAGRPVSDGGAPQLLYVHEPCQWQGQSCWRQNQMLPERSTDWVEYCGCCQCLPEAMVPEMPFCYHSVSFVYVYMCVCRCD